jgi:hypothetical protein
MYSAVAVPSSEIEDTSSEGDRSANRMLFVSFWGIGSERMTPFVAVVGESDDSLGLSFAFSVKV